MLVNWVHGHAGAVMAGWVAATDTAAGIKKTKTAF